MVLDARYRRRHRFDRDVVVVEVEVDVTRFKRVEEVAKGVGMPVPIFMERCVAETTNALWAHMRGHKRTAAGLYIPAEEPIQKDVRKPEPHNTKKPGPDEFRAPKPKKKKRRKGWKSKR